MNLTNQNRRRSRNDPDLSAAVAILGLERDLAATAANLIKARLRLTRTFVPRL
jgi:hypothetical protein